MDRPFFGKCSSQWKGPSLNGLLYRWEISEAKTWYQYRAKCKSCSHRFCWDCWTYQYSIRPYPSTYPRLKEESLHLLSRAGMVMWVIKILCWTVTNKSKGRPKDAECIQDLIQQRRRQVPRIYKQLALETWRSDRNTPHQSWLEAAQVK